MGSKGSGTGAGEVEGLRGQSDEKVDIVLDGHPRVHPLVDITSPHLPANIHVPAEIARHAKAEILDDTPIPQLGNNYPKTPTLFSRISPSKSIQSSALSQHMASPTPPPPPEFNANSRRPSHEDGEILNPIPSMPLPFKRPAYVPPSTSKEPFPFVRKQSAHIPHSHTPPIRPRSFHTSTSPSIHPVAPPTPHIDLPRRSSPTSE
ncbi:hypothetical protein BD779DRAFT_1678627 [Infundibulicybe gibba]|nr:hypothetical protein BD779DRAFT_1678627 [Infundibulicybe gibba]